MADAKRPWAPRRQPGVGPELPQKLLDEFLATVHEDDLDTFRSLLNAHFPDRTKKCPGTYCIYELNDVLEAAARENRAAFVVDLLAYPFHTYAFVASAALSGQAKDVLLVLLKKGWNLNDTSGLPGTSLLARAVQDEEIAQWLLTQGGDPNARSYVDTTALSIAAKYGTPALVRKMLDDYGGDVRRGELLQHALQRPVAGEVVEMLGLLLERGAPLNKTMYADDAPSYGMFVYMDHGTPLHAAAARGQAEAVAFLLAHGADTRVRSSKSQTTARAWAEKAGHADAVALLHAHERRLRLRRWFLIAFAVVLACLATYEVNAAFFSFL